MGLSASCLNYLHDSERDKKDRRPLLVKWKAIHAADGHCEQDINLESLPEVNKRVESSILAASL